MTEAKPPSPPWAIGCAWVLIVSASVAVVVGGHWLLHAVGL